MEEYIAALEKKQLYPKKEEVEQTANFINEICRHLEVREPNKEITLLNKKFTLNRREQKWLYKSLQQFVIPLQAIMESYQFLEKTVKSLLRIEIYQGIVSLEGKLLPRSFPTLILPHKNQHVTYNAFENWIDSVKNPRSLSNILYQAEENNDPVFEGGNVKDFIYVHGSRNLPLRATVIPVALNLYQEKYS
jgi:hypothetical protein